MEILTGNELTSGATVYLDAQNHWVEDLQLARIFRPEEADARDAAIAASKSTLRVVGIEIEKVTLSDGRILPDRLRERIRAQGPTAPAMDRQHLDEDGHVSI